MTTLDAAARWFRGFRPAEPHETTLICLPHAGGNASLFRSWGARLPPSIRVAAVQYPGQEGRWDEPPCVAMPELVEALAEAIATRVEGRVALFGHSVGAIAAFEIARLLGRRHGRVPRHVFVSGCRAANASGTASPVHTRPDEEVLAHVRALGGLPPEVEGHAGYALAIAARLRAGFQLDECYVHTPGPRLTCPINCFHGQDDSDVRRADTERWSGLTEGAFATHVLPGGHFWSKAAEEILLSIVGAALAREHTTAPACEGS